MMNSETYRGILSAKMLLNAAGLLEQHFTVQMDNNPKHTAKTTHELHKPKKRNVLKGSSQSPDLKLFTY